MHWFKYKDKKGYNEIHTVTKFTMHIYEVNSIFHNLFSNIERFEDHLSETVSQHTKTSVFNPPRLIMAILSGSNNHIYPFQIKNITIIIIVPGI